MAALCKSSPLPIALDEELIGIRTFAEKEDLLRQIKPHYIILKPSLLGGFKQSEEWIAIANKHLIGWWATSALESNVGLNAVAQWAIQQAPDVLHGLGTGQLFTNNIPSPLTIKGECLQYDVTKSWEINNLFAC